jgi:cytoskeletal protein RodZ
MAPPPTDIGATLQQARLDRGLAIRDVANVTKISPVSLTAIERNDFGRLPGGVFRRAYIRAFAAEVGLDAEAITRAYLARFEPAGPDEPVLQRRATRRDRARATRRLGALAAGAAVVVVSLVVWMPVPPPGAAPAAGPPPQGVVPVRTTDPPAPADDRDVVRAGATTVGRDGAPVRLEIRVTRPCWVDADADGERVLYRLMEPGEAARVEAQDEITLRVGDAGALHYSMNGADSQPLGRDGEVVTVRITGERLEPKQVGRETAHEGVSPLE